MAAGSAAKVLLACDTRPSSPALLAAAAAGVQALGGLAVDCGRLTTPQLHWQLRRLNQGLPWALEDYFSTLAGAYQRLVKGTEPLGQVRACLFPCPCDVLHGQEHLTHAICTASPGMFLTVPTLLLTTQLASRYSQLESALSRTVTSFHYRLLLECWCCCWTL